MSLIPLIVLSTSAMHAVPQDLIGPVRDSLPEFSRRFVSSVDDGSESNLVVSPYSAGLALSMLGNGLADRDRSSVVGVLGVPKGNLAAYNSALFALQREMDKSGEFGSANGLFFHPAIKPASSYTNMMREQFSAEVQTLPVDTAAQEINSWVSKETKGRIPVLFERLDRNWGAVLVNAITFDGKWQRPFDPAQTKSDWFSAPGGQIEVRMMSSNGQLPFFDFGTFKAVQLDYKGDFSMIAMLPADGTAAQARNLMATFDYRKVAMELESTPVDLKLPKFELAGSIDLEGPLGKLGMSSLFSKADFSPMVPSGDLAAISQAIQKTTIKVDESGTEASAATGIGISRTSASVSRPATFHANKPFAFAIVHRRTGLPIFLGAVTAPNKA